MPTLVVQQGHVPRTRGATGGPHEQQIARAVGALIASMARPPWTIKLIGADEPTSRYAGDAFVALHCDASPAPAARGASVGWRTTEGRALAAAWKAAYAIAGWPGLFRPDNYTAALGGYYGHGRAVAAGNRRAVIVEQGFTTNPTERDWLLTPGGQRASARAVLWAVTGVDPSPVVVPKPAVVTIPTVPAPSGDLTVEAFMATLTEAEQKVLRDLARTVVTLESTGQGVAQAAIEDARARREAGVTEADYRNLVAIRRHLKQVGSTIQGLVIGGVHAVRELGVKTTV